MIGTDAYKLGLAENLSIDAPYFTIRRPSKRRLLLQLLRSDPTFREMLSKQLRLSGVSNRPEIFEPEELGG